MKIVLIGKYNPGEILTGPDKFSKRIFQNAASSVDKFLFLDSFRGKDYSFFTKLFGKEQFHERDLEFNRLGIFNCLFFVFIQIEP